MQEIHGETKHCLVTVRGHQKLYPCNTISQIEAQQTNTATPLHIIRGSEDLSNSD